MVVCYHNQENRMDVYIITDISKISWYINLGQIFIQKNSKFKNIEVMWISHLEHHKNNFSGLEGKPFKSSKDHYRSSK